MKKVKLEINWFGLLMMVVCAVIGIVDSTAAVLGADAVVTPGVDNVGTQVLGGALNTDIERENAKEFIDDPMNRTIVKMYTSDIPLDQFLRHTTAVKQNGMRFSYQSVDTRPIMATVTTTLNAVNATQAGNAQGNLVVDNPNMFDATDIVRVVGVAGWDDVAGATSATDNLMLYVVEVTANHLVVQSVNGQLVNGNRSIPTITQDKVIYRVAHAASEGDVQTAPSSALPQPTENYMQIFKAQIMESKISIDSDKKVDWTPTDQAEFALHTMRKEIEAAYIFGIKGYFRNESTRRYVYTTGGILQQIKEKGTVIQYTPATLSETDMIDYVRTIFTGNSGSSERYLFGGSKFCATLAKMPGVQRQIGATEISRTFGYKFDSIHFGTWVLKTAMHPLLDEYGMDECAIILDLPYLKKNEFRSLTKDVLDLVTSGIYDGSSTVWTEISAPSLRYPQCHALLYPNTMNLI